MPLPSVVVRCLWPFRFGETLRGDPHPKPKSVYEYFTLIDFRQLGIAIVKLRGRFLLFVGQHSELAELEAPPIEFDEKLWHAVVDKVTVYNDDRLVYSLKDGSEITVML